LSECKTRVCAALTQIDSLTDSSAKYIHALARSDSGKYDFSMIGTDPA